MSFNFCSLLILYLLSLGNGQDVNDTTAPETAARVYRAGNCNSRLVHSFLCYNDKPFEMKYELMLKTRYKTGCDYDKITVVWKVFYERDGKKEVVTDNTNQLAYTFRHYLLKATDLTYTLNAWVNSYRSDGTLIEANVTGKTCNLAFQFQTPVAHITGGSMRVVKPKGDIIVDGSGSRNFAFSPLERGEHLKYKWECSKTPGSECKGVSGLTSPKLKVDGQYVNARDEFKFTLTVSAIQKRKTVVSVPSSQQVKVVGGSTVEANIICLKNCPPANDIAKPGMLTALTVKCVKLCEGITDSDYEWAISGATIDYKTGTEYGQHDRDFFIKPHVLKGNQQYEVKLSVRGDLVGMITLTVLAGWELKFCESTPSAGFAGSTNFYFTCDQVKGIHQITSIDTRDGSATVIAVGYPVITTLPIHSTIYMKMIDGEGQISQALVNITINDPYPPEPTLQEYNELAEKFLYYIRGYVKETFHDLIMQNITHSVKQLEKGSKKERGSIRKRFQEEVLKIFLIGANLDNIDYVYQTSTVLRDLVKLHTEDISIELALEITNVCEIIAEAQLRCIENHAYKLDVADATRETTKVLLDCIEMSYSVNKELLIEDDDDALDEISTTLSSVVEGSLIEEEYEDYGQQVAGSHFDSMKIITMNYLKVRQLGGRAVALTMVPSERPLTKITNTTSLLILKQPGDKFTHGEFIAHDISIVPSNDFNDVSVTATGILSTAVNDPFWWNSERVTVVTNVAIIEFHLEDKEATKFKDPVNIYLKFKENIFSSLPVMSAETPDRSNETLDNLVYIYHQDDIIIHRINLWAQGSFMLYFHNLTMDDSFDVIIKDFERPVLEDFKDKTVITQDNPILLHANSKDYDLWSYLAVLPSANRSRSSSEAIKFSFSILTPKCNRWNAEKARWHQGCIVGPGTNGTHLHCVCKSLSAIGGIIFFGRARKENIFRLNFTMELHICYIVPVACALILILYCIIISFHVLFKKNITKDVYFLGDVRFNERYMYLVIVRTGNKMFSGTTSNVMIRISGERGQSREHVLNFPDPWYTLLNRGNEDWFVLATEHHLGRLTKIELWFDHIGARPTWYCSELFVYDFQSLKYWTFPVHTWFKVIDPPNTYMEIHTSDYKKTTKKRFQFLRTVISLFTRSNTWRIFIGSQDDKLPYVAKFTMMFSVIMTIFTVTFVCYGVPNLDIASSFTEYIEVGIRTEVLIITFVTPTCTYILHTILLYFFRNSENQFEVDMYRFRFPVRVLCWIVMILNICGSLMFLLIFGFCMLCVPSVIWLISVIVELLFYILILENIALAFAGSIKDTTKLVYGKGKYIVEQIEAQRVKLYARFGRNLLRPHCEHLYKPLNRKELKVKRLKALAKEDLKRHVGDFIMFCIYLIILYMVMHITRSDDAVYSNMKMGQILEGQVTHTVSYTRVRSMNEFHNYTDHTILKAAYEPTWYGRYVISDPGLMVDVTNKYLGVIRFRQHRAVRDSCKVPKKTRFVSSSCIYEYYLAQDKASYDFKWQKMTGGKPNHSDIERYENMWKYQKSDSWTVGGKFASYPPSGYIFSLGRTLRNSKVNLRIMKNTTWLDNATRAVMIEFLTLSANNNFFNSLLVLVEMSATGYVASSHSIDTIKIFFNENDMSLERFFLFSIFFIILALFFFRIIFFLIRDKRRFFTDFWRYMDFLIVVVSVICICLYVHRTNAMINFIEELERSNHNQFLNYFNLFLIANILTCFCGFLIFLAILRLWRLLRFRLMFRMMERTLLLSLGEIFTMLFYYTAILCSCAVMFTAFFGSYDENFRQFRFSALSLLLITVDMLEDTTVGDSVSQSGFYSLGYLVYGVFSFVSVYGTFLLISIIISNYQASRLYFSNEKDRYDVVKYVKEEFNYYMTLYRIRMLKIRLRSGNEGGTQHVTPKADEYRYSGLKSIPVAELCGMHSITRCLLSHEMKGTDKVMTIYEVKLIQTMLHHHFMRAGEEREFFFKAYVDGRCHLVSDNRIELMAAVTRILLSDFSKKEASSVTTKDTHTSKKLDEINFTLIAHLDLMNGVKISYN